MDRYDVLTVREKDGKTYFTKLGAGFPNRNGDGFTIMLDGVPASVDGQYRLIMKKPLPRDGDGPQRGPSRADLDDDVPF